MARPKILVLVGAFFAPLSLRAGKKGEFMGKPVLTLFALCTIGVSLNSEAAPSYRKPKSNAKVYYCKNKFTIKSEKDIPDNIGKVSGSNPLVWDLQGAILDGSKQSGDGGQGEKQEPLFRSYVSLVVKNGFVRNNKNAMMFYKKNSGINKITFTNIGEDAVGTSKGAYNFSVKNSEFINKGSGDKSIQLNEAKGAEIKGNLVYSGRTCVRIGDNHTTVVSDIVEISNNRFVSCDTALHASKITVYEDSNKFEGVRLKFKSAAGAKFK